MKTQIALILFFSTLLTTNAASASEIIIARAVHKSMKQTIARDLLVLEELHFEQFSSETQKVLGIEQSTNASLVLWLEERVKVIINEKAFIFLNMPLNKSITIEKSNVDYPNPSAVPFSLKHPKENKNDLNESKEKELEAEENLTVMTNLGTALYFNGKSKKQLYNLRISTGLFRSIDILINSPRAGIIQIGPGLFDRRFNINNNDIDSIANSINRLGTFFHEARHSDGHGESLGFAHAVCPKGHDLEGANACDENQNGPYSVGARVVTEMIKACQNNCSARELEILKLTVLDSHNRVLSRTYSNESSTFWSPTPEILE